MDPDVALIAACQQGSHQAFRELYTLYKDRIYGLCRHMSGPAEEAEDLAQEVFIAVFKNIGNFRAQSSFGTWVYRVATNLCLNRLRRRAPQFESVESLSERGRPPADRAPGADELLVRKELSLRLEAAVASLPESLRIVFVLGTLEGMRYKQIAEVCECSEDAVKMRVHRARKHVRKQLRPYVDAGGEGIK